jgi:hypothetical protein
MKNKVLAAILAITMPLWVVPYCIFSRIFEGTYEGYKIFLDQLNKKEKNNG